MRRVHPRLYALAIGIAAVSAAAGGHASVDLLGSLRVFGSAYGRYQHGYTVFAAIIVGAIVLGFFAFSTIGTIVERLRGEPHARRLELLQSIRRPSPAAIALVYGLQIPLLLSLETVEQIQRFGQPLGIGASLGGPPLVALAIHALFALALTLAVFRGIRAIVDISTAIARVIVPLVRRVAVANDAPNPAYRSHRAAESFVRPQPLALHIANRPPPHLAFS